jgi:hypothetical protein
VVKGFPFFEGNKKIPRRRGIDDYPFFLTLASVKIIPSA